MTVATTASEVAYLCDSSDTTFDFTFLVPTGTLVVKVVDLTTLEEETLVENTNYTVSGYDTAAGTVTTIGPDSPYPTGSQIRLIRRTPQTQATSWSNQGPFDPSVLEDALDKLTMLVQELTSNLGQAGTTRQVQVPAYMEADLPSAATKAPSLVYIIDQDSLAVSDGSAWVPLD